MKKKTPEEQGYKMAAIQDGCFIGTENDKDAIVVLARYEKQGKKNLLLKYDTIEFPNAMYLDKFIKEKGVPVVPDEDFKAPKIEQLLHLIKAA
jgi:hypothetical protein